MSNAEIVLDSLHPNGYSRLTTMRLKVPTCVLAQFNTHRMFSRNAASMRAIPTKRIIDDVLADPFIPQFLANQPGMQGGDPLPSEEAAAAKDAWMRALNNAVNSARFIASLGTHKQAVNRLLSPFSYTYVLCTGTGEAWANFIHLRNYSDADKAILPVAVDAAEALRKSTPQQLSSGDAHMPYADNIVQSVARCARVSYQSLTNPGKESTFEEDQKLYAKLLKSDRIHASPAEHQARAAWDSERGGNFGDKWIQYRKELLNEVFTDLSEVLSIRT